MKKQQITPVKNRILIRFSFFLCSILFLGMSACSEEDSATPEVEQEEKEPIDSEVLTAHEIISEMGPGFNLGNTFDNGLNSTIFSDIRPIINLYYQAGMRHVRVPVTWMDRFSDNLADTNGKVDFENDRFKELVKLVDYAVSLEMYIVINTHHEHWLKDHYDGTAAFDQKFTTLWTDIATYFKDYPPYLIFEVLNEPEGKLGEWSSNGEWPSPTSGQALAYTRLVNQVGYDAIRATGGVNETRLVMISPNGQGNEVMIEEVYPVPASLPGKGNDKYLSIQVHSYNPWAFCGQTGSNSAFPGNSSIAAGIQKVAVHAEVLGVPINYGEFGVGRTSGTERNTDLVRGYYKTFAETTLSENMSYSVWDDRGWFGLISGSGSSYNFTNDIVPTMLAQ
ncbi:MAG: cellulase family glycosylhydrolase [Cyclobacteriaceae bacterium]